MDDRILAQRRKIFLAMQGMPGAPEREEDLELVDFRVIDDEWQQELIKLASRPVTYALRKRYKRERYRA